MKKNIRLAAAGMLLLFVAACAQPTVYEWGGYNKALLSYYKNPADTEAFANDLLEAIQKAEGAGKVPPGLYAEYGYALLEIGDAEGAIVYFNKEREAWPEAEFFLTGVINRLGGTAPVAPAEEPEVAPEEMPAATNDASEE